MLRRLHKVDVLVLVPEYSGFNALINSAFDIVQNISSSTPFRYTLVSYPEMDPKFDVDYNRAFRKDRVVNLSDAAYAISDSSLMSYEGRGNFDPYEYIDSEKSFEARVHLVQRWLEEEASEEWYEMNRPDFEFRSESTLGVLLNPYAHEFEIFSRPISDLPNVAVLQSSTCQNELSNSAHIYMAYELLAAPLRFLKGHDQYNQYAHHDGIGCINDILKTPDDVVRRIQGAIVCSQCLNGLKPILPNFELEKYLSDALLRLREMQQNITSLGHSFYGLGVKIVPSEQSILFQDIGIRISFSAKEFALYHFLIEHPMGLSRETVAKERKNLFLYYANIRKALTDQIEVRINMLIDGWQYSNDLRVTVGKINEKFKEIEQIPGMKGWMVTRVGDFYRLHTRR